MGTLGENIKAARLRHDLTQEQLATKIGTTKAAISRYEGDKRQPSWKMLERIAKVLECTAHELFFGHTEEQLHQEIRRAQEQYERELEQFYLPGNSRALVKAFSKLNAEGQRKAIERIEELTEIAKYLADDIE